MDTRRFHLDDKSVGVLSRGGTLDGSTNELKARDGRETLVQILRGLMLLGFHSRAVEHGEAVQVGNVFCGTAVHHRAAGVDA